MSTLSAFKNSFISALKSPHEIHKPRSRRRVIPFNEALERIKVSQTGSVTCAAFHTFGRCRKEIALTGSNFLSNLDKLNMADVQTPIKLMPFMLCSTHWEKTVYYNAMFLDWLSVHGSKQDNQHYENIVIDFQSAIAIDNREISISNAPVTSTSVLDDQGRPVSAPHIFVKSDDGKLNSPQATNELQVHGDHGTTAPTESDVQPSKNLPQISVLGTTESFASIELGVAKLEILYQDSLKCIAMNSDGWRCQEIIGDDQQRKAREVLSLATKSEVDLDIELLPRLVLCPGHALGGIPQAYSDRWNTFAEQRLPKEEAMAKFDAEFWMSVQFFKNENTNEHTSGMILNRPRSASNLSAHQRNGEKFTSTENTEIDSQQSASKSPQIEPHEFKISLPNTPLSFRPITARTELDVPSSRNLFKGFRSAENLSTRYIDTGKPTLEDHVLKPSPTPEPLSNSKNRASVTSSLETAIKSATMSKNFLGNQIKDDHPANASSNSVVVSEEGTQPEDEKIGRKTQHEKSTAPSPSEKSPPPLMPSCSQAIIDQNLLKEMSSPFPQMGYVYIYKSHDGRLAKFDTREAYIYNEQTPLKHDLPTLIRKINVNHPQRVLNLIHLELENFRAKDTCPCYHDDAHWGGSGTENLDRLSSNWFDVSESVAINSVKLWSGFVLQAYTSEGSIKGNWQRNLMCLSLTTPSLNEVQFLESGIGGANSGDIELHHKLRQGRYEKWMAAIDQ